MRRLSIPPKTRALIAFVALSLIVGRGFTAVAPNLVDARLFAYIGSEWLAGAVPYADIWDNKPPGIFATTALVFWLFPDNFTALAVLEGIWIAACNLSIFALMRTFGARWDAAAVATAVSAAACNLSYYNHNGGLTEIYLIGPAAISMAFFAKGFLERRFDWMFLAGLCTGVASLYKTPGLSPFLAQICFLLSLALLQRYGWRQWLGSVAVNAFGIISAWAPFVVYFWRRGVLFELFDATLFYNVTYGAAGRVSFVPSVLRVQEQLQPFSTLVICAVVVAVFVTLNLKASPRSARAREDKIAPLTLLGLLTVLWVLFDMAGALAGGRDYSHYFLTLAPSLSATAGVAYWIVSDAIGASPLARPARTLVAALLLGPLLLVQMRDANELRYVWRAPRAKDAYDRGMEFLLRTRKPTDTMFIWDFLPRFYSTVKMRSPSRYVSATYILDSPVTADRVRERIVSDLEHTPPSFLVDVTDNEAARAAAEPAYRWLRSFIDQHYRLAFSEDRLKIYALDRAISSATAAMCFLQPPARRAPP